MAQRYLIPATERHQVEEHIKRSRFIATATHAPDAESAKAFIDSIRAEHPGATHNCWAFAAGPPADTAHVGMSDDGEPHGTAGRPMLHTLLHSEIGEVAIVVTRYFGGTKLGTGGLVRAYSGLVSLALDSLPTREKVDTTTFTARIGYTFVTQAKRLLPGFEAEITAEDYTAEVAFTLTLPEEHAEALKAELTELTNGTAVFK